VGGRSLKKFRRLKGSGEPGFLWEWATFLKLNPIRILRKEPFMGFQNARIICPQGFLKLFVKRQEIILLSLKKLAGNQK
jgi:hypothetical protein